MEVAKSLRPFVIPNPVAGHYFDRDSLRIQFHRQYPGLRDRHVVLFLSRLDEIKGLDLLLPAFAILRRQMDNVSLIVAGGGTASYAARLRQMARTLGIEADITWTGFIDEKQKFSAMAGATVFVLPSYSENFGIAVVEAMACGLPVVVSDRVAIHGEVSAARAGLVVPCNIDALAKSMESILKNPNLQAEMATNAMELAKTFSTNAVTSKIIALYEEVLYRKISARPPSKAISIR